MKPRICSAAVAGSILLLAARSVQGGGTNVVYTYAGSFNLAIPADPLESRGWMQDAVICVPRHIVVVDLNVLVNIRHTAAFDLQLFLKGPSGRVVKLAASEPREGYYKGADYAGTQFDDEAETSIQDASPPFTGSFRPYGALTVFDGHDAYGAWTLEVYDAYYGDVGRLDSFALTITGPPAADIVEVPAPPAGILVILGAAFLKTARRPCHEPPAPASS